MLNIQNAESLIEIGWTASRSLTGRPGHPLDRDQLCRTYGLQDDFQIVIVVAQGHHDLAQPDVLTKGRSSYSIPSPLPTVLDGGLARWSAGSPRNRHLLTIDQKWMNDFTAPGSCVFAIYLKLQPIIPPERSS